MTPEQCKAARQLLGWTARDLAQHAGVSVDSVRRFETPSATGPFVKQRTSRRMADVLEASGVEFVDVDPRADASGRIVAITLADGSTVRLRAPADPANI